MSDVNELLIQPLQKFSKDSMHLIKKCTKPDRKGKSQMLFSSVLPCEVLVCLTAPSRSWKFCVVAPWPFLFSFKRNSRQGRGEY